MYIEEFKEWWKERSKHIPKLSRTAAKRWAWIGWEAYQVDKKQREDQHRKDFSARLAADAAKGINIHSPGYWGDFS